MAISRTQFEGREFDWFAVDAKGHLALCSSAGYGEIPSTVVTASSIDDSPILFVAALIKELAITGDFRSVGRGPGACKEWPMLGYRGVYVFDWVHWRGPYAKIIAPNCPVEFSVVSSDLLKKLRPVCLDQFVFLESADFDGAKFDQSCLRIRDFGV